MGTVAIGHRAGHVRPVECRVCPIRSWIRSVGVSPSAEAGVEWNGMQVPNDFSVFDGMCQGF